jgi:deferrochelatase/peroxidase EfeB
MDGPAFINIVIAFAPHKAKAVNRRIGQLTDPSRGNYPKLALENALRKVRGLHYMTLTVASPLCPAEVNVKPDSPPPEPTDKPAHLIIEMTADFGAAVVLPELVQHFHASLLTLLAAAGISRTRQELLDYLLKKEVVISDAWGGTLGQVFSGSPGLTVDRIIQERKLAQRLQAIVDGKSKAPGWSRLSPRQQLECVRNELWLAEDVPWKWAFVAESSIPTETTASADLKPTNPNLWKAIRSAVNTLAGPLYAPIVIVVLLAGIFEWREAGWVAAVMWASFVLVLIVVLLGIGAFLAWERLRSLEDTDGVDERIISDECGTELLSKENFGQQNHMTTVSRLKGGLFRRLTLRFAFIGVGASGFVNTKGFLGKNGVIHSARWMRLPKTDQLMFWSNYDGTWESYVGDFIADAPQGVTGIWSNCVGFPRTHGLIAKGAMDENRTERWARRQQTPTRFWYAAYRDLSAARIRVNAAIRQGFATAETYQACEDWFALFGSRPRPPGTVQVSEISTIVFGGLSRMRYSGCFVISLNGADLPRCKTFIAAMRDCAVYGQAHADMNTAVVAGLSAQGLERLGLDREAIETFSLAFKQGMSTADRARELGDRGGNDPKHWKWGQPGAHADVLILAYARTATDFVGLVKNIRAEVQGNGHRIAQYQPLTLLADRFNEHSRGIPSTEPFGFADGISQPIIRGVPQRKRHENPNDMVEPGELILGYPDNLGVIPPGPYMEAKFDPDHRLPDAAADPLRGQATSASYGSQGRRDLGMNGTFLVVRQYRQNVDAFDTWFKNVGFRLSRAAQADTKTAAAGAHYPVHTTPHAQGFPLSASLPMFDDVKDTPELKELLFAKLLGRWQDGASLVRHAGPPRSSSDGRPRRRDNDFLSGAEDPAGLACPFGSHVRRANPRDTRFPGSATEIASVNRHRMLRVSRVFGKLDPNNCRKVDPTGNPGVLFMCLNGDIERQFEFVQKAWLLNPSIQGLEQETDPIVGSGSNRWFTIPTANGPVRLPNLPDLTRLIGGGYFFVPSRALLDYLAAPKASDAG